MNTTVLASSTISTRSRNAILTVIAIGLGVTLPRIFHIAGLGPVFLPMFLPMIILALVAGPYYLLLAAVATPLLSTALFDIPVFSTSCIMIVQLALLGTTFAWLRSKNISLWIAVPFSICIERMVSLVIAVTMPVIHIAPKSILQSYPGIIVLVASVILFGSLYDNRK
jgi:hypothetical protein